MIRRREFPKYVCDLFDHPDTDCVVVFWDDESTMVNLIGKIMMFMTMNGEKAELRVDAAVIVMNGQPAVRFFRSVEFASTFEACIYVDATANNPELSEEIKDLADDTATHYERLEL